MEPQYDYIPVDPAKWIDRLIEVNEGAQFSKENKKLIDEALKRLYNQLMSV